MDLVNISLAGLILLFLVVGAADFLIRLLGKKIQEWTKERTEYNRLMGIVDPLWLNVLIGLIVFPTAAFVRGFYLVTMFKLFVMAWFLGVSDV